jgi:5-methylcytosine-specific restriction endonuclease McrA
MTITQSTIDRLMKEQKGVCCNCGRDLYNTGYHVHHCCYTRDVRFSKWLDQIFNLELICPKCHANHGRLSNLSARQKAWKRKIEMGYEMQKWADSIPMLVKDRFENE